LDIFLYSEIQARPTFTLVRMIPTFKNKVSPRNPVKRNSKILLKRFSISMKNTKKSNILLLKIFFS